LFNGICKGDIIAESCVNGEIRNIKISDVFLVKDLTYNLLSVSNLDKMGFIINIKNGKLVGITDWDGNLYKLLNIYISECCAVPVWQDGCCELCNHVVLE
jgi:hypothetical protein